MTSTSSKTSNVDFSKQLDRNKKTFIASFSKHKSNKFNNIIKKYSEEHIFGENKLNKFLINSKNKSKLYEKITITNEKFAIPDYMSKLGKLIKY